MLARFRDGERSLDSFDFEFNKKMNCALIYELATARFIGQREHVLLLRPAMRGQESSRASDRATRRSSGGIASWEAHVFIEERTDATLDGTRNQYFANLSAVPLLIVDDLEMRKLPHIAGEDLLELIMRRYEHSSTILTWNRPVDDWDKLLGDTAAVNALLDRLLHHAHVIKCGPRSWRAKVHGDLHQDEANPSVIAGARASARRRE